MNELKNIDVHIISIVDKGANLKSIIWKSVDQSNQNYNRVIPIKKVDDDKKIIYGIVYSPNQIDAHGDYATADEIEKACYGFMRKSKTGSVDTQHDMDVEKNCYVGESWIVKDNDALFPEEVGAWAVALKIENEEIWKDVKAGKYTGISMYGTAEKLEKSSDDHIEKGIISAFRKIFGINNVDHEEIIKDFNDRMIMMDFPKLLDALYSAAYDVLYDENIVDKTKGILECVEQFKAHIANIDTAKSIAKAGKMISEANMKKLTAAMESISAILEAALKQTEKRQNFINKSSVRGSKQGETEMTAEEIQKQIDEAIKPVKDENEKLSKENKDLKDKVESLEKRSNGSAQVDGSGAPSNPEVKKVFPWATLGVA